MVIVIFSAPPLLGGLATLQRFTCNVCSAAPNFRVIAHCPPVKNIFGELSSFFTAPRLSTEPGNPVYLWSAKAPPSRRGTTGTVFSARQKSRSFSYPRRSRRRAALFRRRASL